MSAYVDPVDMDKQVRAAEWLDALLEAGADRLSWQALHEFHTNAVRKMGLAPGACEMAKERSGHSTCCRRISRAAGFTRMCGC